LEPKTKNKNVLKLLVGISEVPGLKPIQVLILVCADTPVRSETQPNPTKHWLDSKALAQGFRQK
jgi:hypothetical protein